MMQSNCSPCKEESPNPPDVKTASQPPFKIHYLLALMARLLTCQVIFFNAYFLLGGEENTEVRQKRQCEVTKLSYERK